MNSLAEEDRAPSAGPVAVIVAYDITENRRRTRLHRLLRGFGEPLQKSVFLCWVDAARQRRLKGVLDDFSRAPHQGRERIDCIESRADSFARPEDGWVFE